MSRGSVIPKFIENAKAKKTLSITHPEMTRFNITLDEGVNFVIYSLINSIGGEIFVPKLASFKIIDLLKCFDEKVKYKITGIRPGERTAEYIDTILMRLTTVGALYLTFVCLMPEFLIAKYPIPFYLGGTSILIVVVVAMDTVTQVQTRLMSSQYESLIKKTKFGK